MTIFRVQHNKNYTVINNTIFEDAKISWKAKGIWTFAFSRPDNWTFLLSDLVKRASEGKDSVMSGLKELEEAGYLVRTQSKNTDGKFLSYEWTFYETPQTIQKMLPQTGFPLPEDPLPENPPLLSTEVLTSTEEVVCCADAPGIVFKENFNGDKVRIDQGDIFRQVLLDRINCTTDQLKAAWKILAEYAGPIHDAFLFVKATLENLVVKQKSQNIKKSTQRNSCNSNKAKETSSTPMPQNSSDQNSASVMKKRAPVNLSEMIETYKKRANGSQTLSIS